MPFFCSRIQPRMLPCFYPSCLIMVIFDIQILYCLNLFSFVFSLTDLERPFLAYIAHWCFYLCRQSLWIYLLHCVKLKSIFPKRFTSCPQGWLMRWSISSILAGNATHVSHSCAYKDFPNYPVVSLWKLSRNLNIVWITKLPCSYLQTGKTRVIL